jgi:hypothetical protein
MAPSIDIVIRSHYRDLRWLVLSLRAIDLFATGHRQVVVVVPRATLPRITALALLPQPGVQIRTCPDRAQDYIGQQITKLYADRYTDADMIVHLDSDQVFVEACDLRERLFDGCRPRMSYDSSDRRPVTDGWRRCPEIFFGQRIAWDLTIAPPQVLPRQVYPALRTYCRRQHGVSMSNYAQSTRPDRFCELALLRGFVLLHEPASYTWVDVRHADLLPECRTFWSRAETPESVAQRLPAALAP